NDDLVKYEYRDEPSSKLIAIIIAALPYGKLQDRYNPTAADTIWRAGRNAPTLGELFRVRLVFDLLKTKKTWRVQSISLPPNAPAPTSSSFPWDE
ncbi:MAG: SfiI family type II restriction endonuclease, partial [Candidatus Acidiferrum sp.]